MSAPGTTGTPDGRPRLRDRDDFAAVLAAAAERTGVRGEVVEKDYWVTQALRVLAERFPDDFVFKGGTSLSKAYGLLRRFSEDVDVLILKGDRGSGACRTLMKRMAERVRADLGLADAGTPESGRWNRTAKLRYPPRASQESLEPTVLLEMGARGRDEPRHEDRPIRPLLADALRAAGQDPTAFADTAAFEVPVLHPARTLVEKLALIHALAQDDARRQQQRQRYGRHLYDIHQLLSSDEVTAWLRDNTGEFISVAEDVDELSRAEFGSPAPRPEGGFAASPAFATSGEAARACASAYDEQMKVLYLGSDDPPTWAQIRERVQQYAALL